MNTLNNFILIASWKYEKGELIERQRYDKQGRLVEYKTRVQLKKELDELDERNIKEETIYDDFGNLIEKRLFNNGEPESKDCYEYDDNHNRIKSYSFFTDSDDADHQVISFYNKNREMVKHEFYENNEFTGISIHEYDMQGNRIALILHDASGHLESMQFFKHLNDKLVEQKCYDEKSHLCWTNVKVYNKEGRLIESDYEAEFLFYRVIITYDETDLEIISEEKFVHKDYLQNCSDGEGPYIELGVMLDTRSM
jgi:hypothetical protein